MKKIPLLLALFLFASTLIAQQSMAEILVHFENAQYSLVSKTEYKNYKYAQKSISKTTWNALGLDRLEQYNDQFDYSARDLRRFDNFSILLVERAYPHESTQWMLVLDQDLNIVDHLMTAYDNDEGFTQTRANYNKGKLTIYHHNIYESPNKWESCYTADDKGFAPIQELYTVTAKSGLSIRAEAKLDAKRITVAPYNSTLVLITSTMRAHTAQHNGYPLTAAWLKVKIPVSLQKDDWTQGYVYSGFLKKTFTAGRFELTYEPVPAAVFLEAQKQGTKFETIENAVPVSMGEIEELADLWVWHAPNKALRFCTFSSEEDVFYLEELKNGTYQFVTNIKPSIYQHATDAFWVNDEVFYISFYSTLNNKPRRSKEYYKVGVVEATLYQE